jgi:hypothetical protein
VVTAELSGQMRLWVRIALLALLLLAFYLRIIDLDTAPPGLYYDEAAHGLDAAHVWAGQWHIFFPTANGHEPLFTYLVAGFYGVLENTILAVRLPAAMLGTLAVAATFALGRRLLDPRLALIGAALVAVTFWTVTLSRIGYRANALPVLFPLWLLAFWNCRNRKALAPYLLCGLLLGLTQYTYTAARFVPLLAVILVFDWRRTLSRPGLWWGAGVAALVALPLAWAILSDLEIGAQRIRQAALWNRPEPFALFWLQLRNHLGMFGLTGDPLWIHNLPFRPPLSLPVALLFAIGAVAGWRKAGPRALIWSIAVLLWPGILAVSNNPAPPDHLRVLVIAAPTFLLAGWGLGFVTRGRNGWLIPLALAVLLYDGGRSWRDYQQWTNARQTYEQFDADMTRIARKVVDHPHLFYLVPLSPDWHEFEPGRHWTIDYLSNERDNYYVVGVPYDLPDLAAEQVALVKWLAGMHLSADPQRTLEGELHLLGYTKMDEETENTFLLEYYQHTGDPVEVVRFAPQQHYEGGLQLTALDLFLKLQTDGSVGTVIAEINWESTGPYDQPIAVSLRLQADGGATVAQVDSVLWNDVGETAERWRTPERSRLFLELGTQELPAGDYSVILLAYDAVTLAPLPVLESDASPDGMVVNRLILP